MDSDITAIFLEYIKNFHSYDIAESEFKKNMHEDPELRKAYKEWCDSVGSTEKNGFMDFCEEWMESQDDIWETLNDYDAE